MADYILAVGTHDPHGFSAATTQEAIDYAIAHVDQRLARDLSENPQEVLTLMGPEGLITRPSERLDEFVGRRAGRPPGLDATTIKPGDANTPDCNGD